MKQNIKNVLGLTAGLGVGFLLACGGNPLPATQEVFEAGEGASKLESFAAPEQFTYGADGVGVRLLSYSPGQVCAKFEVGNASGSVVHLAAFEIPGQLYHSHKSRGYVQEDQTFTVCIPIPARCGLTHQVDAGTGPTPPDYAQYEGYNFIMSWEVGEPCGQHIPDPTPTPRVTPTPGCEECSSTPTPTPTKTPRPRYSPTPTRTPTPTKTPTVAPSPTPTMPPVVCSVPSSQPIKCINTLGNPSAECSYFGLVPVAKDDNLNASTHRASRDADLAIVKNGKGPCSHGQSAYRIYKDVTVGDQLEKPLNSGSISHVTYCECSQ